MKKYTTKIHVKRLKKMLKRKNLKMCCPANWRFCIIRDRNDFKYDFEITETWDLKNGPYPCYVCTSFVGLRQEDPCYCKMGDMPQTF